MQRGLPGSLPQHAPHHQPARTGGWAASIDAHASRSGAARPTQLRDVNLRPMHHSMQQCAITCTLPQNSRICVDHMLPLPPPLLHAPPPPRPPRRRVRTRAARGGSALSWQWLTMLTTGAQHCWGPHVLSLYVLGLGQPGCQQIAPPALGNSAACIRPSPVPANLPPATHFIVTSPPTHAHTPPQLLGSLYHGRHSRAL